MIPSFTRPGSANENYELSALDREQRAFSLDAPAISRQRAVVPDNPVTRDRNRERIRGARLRHRACPCRQADPRGDFRVARRGTRGDLAERLPHALLKCGSAYVERKVEPDGWRFDEADHRRNRPFKRLVSTDDRRAREAVLKVARTVVVDVAHKPIVARRALRVKRT